MKSTNKRINLDWNKLMGFNQVASAQADAGKKTSRSALGAKIGGKIGAKAGVKGGGPPPA
jgi:hypothetical protein